VDTEQSLLRYLTGLGFSTSAIVFQPRFGPEGKTLDYRPDIALIDPASGDLLAILEVKLKRDRKTLCVAANQLGSYLAALGDPAVRAFVAVPSKSGEGFAFFELREDGEPQEVSASRPLSPASLSGERLAAKKAQLKATKEKTTDRFAAVCRVTAASLLLLGVLDWVFSLSGVELLTNNRMLILGAVVGLVLVPYLSKIKILGVEIERMKERSSSW